MSYAFNKANSRTRTTGKSLTDQSQAKETDINIIVNRFLKTGNRPLAAKQPIAGDFSQLPRDLRGFIHQARSIRRLRERLPDALKEKTVEELMSLTGDELKKILAPPAEPPAKKADEPPKEPAK